MKHVCRLRRSDGEECGRALATRQALGLHKRSTSGGEHGHGQTSYARRLVVCNTCPVCLAPCSTVEVCKRHL